ncbi:MAG: endonuclease I family protein [Pseudobdellovibrionaceae bacterium]
MKTQGLIGILFLSTLSACSHLPQQTEVRRSVAEENAPSTVNQNTEPVWVDNPCFDQAGMPFRKYQQFALDKNTNKILAKKSLTAAVETRNEHPKQGEAWSNVEQFLGEVGILNACSVGKNPSQALSKPPQNNANNQQEAAPSKLIFVMPIQFDTNRYYASVDLKEPLRMQLEKFLNSSHLQEADKADVIVSQCPQKTVEQKEQAGSGVCVTPHTYSYYDVRKLMFGGVDLKKNDDGSYAVYDYYCQKWVGEEDFKKITSNPSEMPGPGNIVHSKVMNVEHSWPQSKFKGNKSSFENLVQKTDLHHIFPTDTEVNRIRSNYEFANVEEATAQRSSCSDSKLGHALPIGEISSTTGTYFEPPTQHKGNVARALFYFSVKYNGGMSALQEAYLRKWNEEDPVDQMEKERNEKIYRLTGVRNPFVDHPEWAQSIARFCRVRTDGDNLKKQDGIDCEAK